MRIFYVPYENLDVHIELNSVSLKFFTKGEIKLEMDQMADSVIYIDKRFAGRASPGAPAPVESNPETKSKGVTQT